MYAPQQQDPIVFLAQQMQAFQQQLSQIAEVVGALQQQVMQAPPQQWPNYPQPQPQFQQPGRAQQPQQQYPGQQQRAYQPQGWPQAPQQQHPQQPLPGQRQFTSPQEDEAIAGMLGMDEYARGQPSFPMPQQQGQGGPQAAPNEVIVARMLRMAQMQNGMGG